MKRGKGKRFTVAIERRARGGHRRFTTFTFRGRKGNTAKRHFLECFSLPHKPQRYVGSFFPSPPTGVAGLRQLTADPKFYLPPWPIRRSVSRTPIELDGVTPVAPTDFHPPRARHRAATLFSPLRSSSSLQDSVWPRISRHPLLSISSPRYISPSLPSISRRDHSSRSILFFVLPVLHDAPTSESINDNFHRQESKIRSRTRGTTLSLSLS